MDRRTVLGVTTLMIGSPALSVVQAPRTAATPARLLKAPKPPASIMAYNGHNAPDAMSQLLIATPIPHVRNDIHWGLAIEQNIARRDPRQLERWWAGLQPAERADLAQVYTNLRGGQGPLLDLMAVRLSGATLGDVSRHFGFGPVYAAIYRCHQSGKAYAMEQASDPNWVAPTVGATTAPSERAVAPASTRLKRSSMNTMQSAGFKPSVDMTIRQIYLGFRSAAAGGLSIKAALFETTMYAGLKANGGVSGAWFFGYNLLGPIARDLLSEYAPERYHDLGAAVAAGVDPIRNLFLEPEVGGGQPGSMQYDTLGKHQKHGSEDLGIEVEPHHFLGRGGDYGVTHSWNYHDLYGERDEDNCRRGCR